MNSLRSGLPISLRQQVVLTLQLSWPAIMAQISSIVMQYIDASMVGHLGSGEAASIGLVTSTTWLFTSLSSSITTGFCVMVAHRIGAQKPKESRNIIKLSFLISMAFTLLLMAAALLLAKPLPRLLGADASIWQNASSYFFIYALSLPFLECNALSAGHLQASGNMHTPSVCLMLMCLLDVVFNIFFIFPSGTLHVASIMLPGLNLGVKGAALGTALSELIAAMFLLFFLFFRSPELRWRREEKFTFSLPQLRTSLHISSPVAMEKVILAGAQVVSTIIIAPLGNIAIAAHSFAVTAESLCYMPSYGIQSAASTLVGQSIGAQRKDLTYRLGWLTVSLAMLMMSVTGVLLYLLAPWMMGLLSNDAQVIALGTQVLRIEAFAEPLYGAAIVANGVFQGAGSTLLPTLLNFGSMWGIRIPFSALLAPRLGLPGVWLVMCVELCVRGTLFLICMARKRWLPPSFRE